MNKYIKLALKIVGGIVAVFITLAIVLIVFVDPNDYKQEIANLVKSKTGYSVNIRGNISLSVFPWIGVQVNDVEVENPPGYKGKTLALVGESGCGKTTVGKSILQLIDSTGGNINFNGQQLTGLTRQQLRPIRSQLQFVFQDPY